ncbi:MAG: hypothetical protein AAFY83_04410 [Pseudomonadota bacterium]
MKQIAPGPLYGFFTADKQTRSVLMTAFFIIGVLAVVFVAALVDPRTLNGVNIWTKPLKFSIALVVHGFTLAILMQQLTVKQRTGWLMGGVTAAYGAAIAFETAYITIQSMRGRASHYNNETILEQVLYGFMGFGAVLLVMLPMVIALLVWRQRGQPWTGYRLGTVLGCLIGPILTIVYGFTLSFGNSHFVDAPPGALDVPGLPFLGWSTQYADLRPAHFFALHMIQASPLTGWLMDRFVTTGSYTTARLAAIAISIVFAALSTWLFFNAMAGNVIPFV